MRTKLDYFNPNGVDTPLIKGGNPTGFVNFNDTQLRWANNSWKLMRDLTWFSSEIDCSNEAKSFALLNENEQMVYKLVFANLSFLDSSQESHILDFRQHVSNRILRSTLTYQAQQESNHCYIAGTEVLTADGFKDFRELTYSDKVANYHEDGSITFSEPTDIINSDYKGKMYKFEQTNYCQIVTPNHRVVMKYPFYDRQVKNGNAGKVRVGEAEKVSLRNYNLPIAGIHRGSKIELSPLERLAIAFQADGGYMNKKWCIKRGYDPLTYCKEDNHYSYRFSFKREDKIERLRSLLVESGLDYSEKINNKSGYTHFYVSSPMLFDKTFSWVNLLEIDAVWGLSFIDELKYWDGSIRPNDSVLFTNTNKIAVDKVVAVAAISGSQTGTYHINPEVTKGNNLIDAWQVHIVPNKVSKTGREIKKTEIDYEGSIHCCTVESGILVCRYKDSVFVSGNSESYAVVLSEIGNSEEVFNMYRTEDILLDRNEKVAAMFARYINGTETQEMIGSAMASIMLEGVLFLTSFSYVFVLGEKMQGSSSMVQIISRDEISAHAPIFANIFKNLVAQNKPTKEAIDAAISIVHEAVQIEKDFASYICKNYPILGIREDLLHSTIENFANDRLRVLKLPLIFPERPKTSLEKLVDKFAKVNDSKSNFFESSVKTYSKGSITLDDF